jgi:hypothetical protein
MKDEFIPYEQALELKGLGFDEPCFGYYSIDSFNLKTPTFNMGKPFEQEWCLPAPLYQQAFRWFREKHVFYINSAANDLFYFVYYYKAGAPNDPNDVFVSEVFETYEKAELACLKKLIELSTKTA